MAKLDQLLGTQCNDVVIFDDAIAGGGDDAFTWIGTSAFSNVAGQLRFEIIGGNAIVMGDTNGDGVTDFMLRIDGGAMLEGDDFTL